MAYRRKRVKGRGPRLRAIGKFLSKAHTFIRKHRLISRGAKMAGQHERFKKYADPIGKVAGNLGYGRRKGYGLKLSGSGLSLAGGSCRKYCRRRKR